MILRYRDVKHAEADVRPPTTRWTLAPAGSAASKASADGGTRPSVNGRGGTGGAPAAPVRDAVLR